MWPDRVSNPRPLALESDALPIALRGPATTRSVSVILIPVYPLLFSLFVLFYYIP